MLKLMETCFLPTKQILIIAKEQKMWVSILMTHCRNYNNFCLLSERKGTGVVILRKMSLSNSFCDSFQKQAAMCSIHSSCNIYSSQWCQRTSGGQLNFVVWVKKVPLEIYPIKGYLLRTILIQFVYLVNLVATTISSFGGRPTNNPGTK